jgi:hypothetical protein
VLAAKALWGFGVTTILVLVLLALGGVGGWRCTEVLARRWEKSLRVELAAIQFKLRRAERLRSEDPTDWGITAEQVLLGWRTRQQMLLQELRGLKDAWPGRSVLAIAVWLLPPPERARYFEEFRAELLDIPSNTRLSHALSLVRGVFVLRLRRGFKNTASDVAGRRAKG